MDTINTFIADIKASNWRDAFLIWDTIVLFALVVGRPWDKKGK